MPNDTTPAPTRADAWMNPDTLDVINAGLRKFWLDNYGSRGREEAAKYTVPLVRASRGQAPAGAPAWQGRWAWVPVEPSTAMLVAGNHGQPGDFSALKVWQDMLDALQRSHDYTRPVDPPAPTAQPAPVPAAVASPSDEEIDAEVKQWWGDMRGAPLLAHRTFIRLVLEKWAAPAPAAQGDAHWPQLRSALAMAMLGWGRRPDRTMETCYAALDAITEPGMPLALLRAAPDWRDAARAAKEGDKP